MAKCFVIMPITTPEALVPTYAKDPDHFYHLLQHLFVPAIKNADFDPILPVAQGADVIHAEIVKNLETADLVLCDISTLNPNVFFELGCRTALNKPVCYVMDDLTRGIPFDTGIINHHVYGHTLAPWTLNTEIERLSAHIRLSADRSAGKNMLWEYFGLRSTAHAVESQGNEQDRLAYLVIQVDAIKKRLEERPAFTAQFDSPSTYLAGSDAGAYTVPGVGGTAFNVRGANAGGFTVANVGGTGFTIPGYSGSVFNFPRDWNKELEDSENVLQQIQGLRKADERSPDIEPVRNLIEQHINSLQELIEAEPEGVRSTKARSLQFQFRALL